MPKWYNLEYSFNYDEGGDSLLIKMKEENIKKTIKSMEESMDITVNSVYNMATGKYIY